MDSSKQPALLALDWGTSSLRAYLLAGATDVLAKRSADWGIMHLPEGGFAGAVDALCGDWLREHRALPVIAAGMVGSAQGWLEVPYVAAPASPLELAHGLRHADGPNGRRIAIVPGVLDDGNRPNVMRGEETQVFGALQIAPALFDGSAEGILVLPGTHSKWVRVEGGEIVSFLTFMTGEMFAVLRQHSILGRLMQDAGGFDVAAFERGLTEAESGSGLLSSLFSVRSQGLTKRLDHAQLPDYLSGLLIGSEIVEARRLYASLRHPVPLIGAAALCKRYALALARFGIAVHGGDFAGATPAGLWEVARHAGMIPTKES